MSPRETKRKKAKHDIGAILARLERECRREATDKETARAIGITPGRYSDLKHGWGSPTLEQLYAFSRYFDVPLMEFFPPECGFFVRERDGLRWQVRTGLRSLRERTIRDATELVLRGKAPAEIAEVVAPTHGREDPGATRHAEWMIPTMVRAGLTLRLVELVVSSGASEIQDAALGGELATALAGAAGRTIAVHVVRNVAHPDFARDPIAPFLAARVAHMVVARFLSEYPLSSTLGIAGGIHLATFVRSIGPDSSPFPERGDRHFVLVPLTLEPFHDHRFELADSLVGEFHARAAMLFGPLQVRAPSFKPFGYLEDGKVGVLESDSIPMVREEYLRLDAAIFGCGDASDDGWIDSMRKMLRLDFDHPPPTDVCLNMLSEGGEPIPLPEHGGRREYLGVGLDEIQRLAARKDKLALLLASGESKGLPIKLVARAGYANAVVCDQSAARAALGALRGKSSG